MTYTARTHRVVFRLVMLAALLFILFGCASTKPCPPCPPAEIVTVQVPGPVVPCPAPPTITPPQLWLLDLSASGATIQEIATALEHDRQELIRVLAEYQAVLEVYRNP
jgi:hypothetical protein